MHLKDQEIMAAVCSNQNCETEAAIIGKLFCKLKFEDSLTKYSL